MNQHIRSCFRFFMRAFILLLWLGLSGAAWAASSRKSWAADVRQSVSVHDPFFILMVLIAAGFAFLARRQIHQDNDGLWFTKGIFAILGSTFLGVFGSGMICGMFEFTLDEISGPMALAALFGSIAGTFSIHASKTERPLKKDIEPPVGPMKKRTAPAFIVCFILFFVYILAKGIVRAAGFGLGAIPDTIFCLILFAVWRVIRGTGSDSATLPNSPAPLLGATEPAELSAFELLAKEKKKTLAKSAAPSRPPLKPMPSSTLANSPPPLLGTTEPAELSAFELLAKEKETGFRHEALWLKCFSDSEGDQARAEAAYNRERATALVAQEVAEKRAALAKDIARLMAWRAEISRHMAKLEKLFEAVPPRKAAEAVHMQVGNRVEMETVEKTLPHALAEFQTAAKKLQSEIQPSEWEGGHLMQPLAAAVKGDTVSSLTWFECLALVNQGETWKQLDMRVQDAIHRLEDWLLLHAAHAQTLTDADAAISDKQSAKIISALHDKLRGVRFADLNYKNLEGFIVARESRSVTLLLSTICLIIVGFTGFGIYSAQTGKPLHGSQTPGADQQPSAVMLSANASIIEIRRRAEMGEKEAQFRLGVAYHKGEGVLKDDVEAVRWYRLAAEQGHAEAQNSMGYRHGKGEGVLKDDVEAVRWYRKAAEQGNAQAQSSLGYRYHKGEGVAQDDVEAVRWYLKAAVQGDAWAQNSLGVRYHKGEGVAQDDVEAVRWYRLAADQGDAEAQNSLGVRYHEGKGVPKDDVEAVRWYRKAAEQGYAWAQNNLGVRYHEGKGAPHDDVEAVKWFILAAAQQNKASDKSLAGIVKEMTREQLAEAQRRVDEFKRQHVDVSNQ